MEKRPDKRSPELSQIDKLVIEGVANGIERGHFPREYGEMLIRTYQNAVLKKSPEPEEGTGDSNIVEPLDASVKTTEEISSPDDESDEVR